MRKMIQMYFGIFTGNAILAPIGFMGPSPYLAGVGATVLAVGSFAVMAFLDSIDKKTRRDLSAALSSFRDAAENHPEHWAEIRKLEDRVIAREPLITLSHDVGKLHGKLTGLGIVLPESQEIQDASV